MKVIKDSQELEEWYEDLSDRFATSVNVSDAASEHFWADEVDDNNFEEFINTVRQSSSLSSSNNVYDSDDDYTLKPVNINLNYTSPSKNIRSYTLVVRHRLKKLYYADSAKEAAREITPALLIARLEQDPAFQRKKQNISIEEVFDGLDALWSHLPAPHYVPSPARRIPKARLQKGRQFNEDRFIDLGGEDVEQQNIVDEESALQDAAVESLQAYFAGSHDVAAVESKAARQSNKDHIERLGRAEHIEIPYESEEVRALSIQYLRSCRSLNKAQREDVIFALSEMSRTPVRQTTLEQQHTHRRAQEDMITALSDLARVNDGTFQGVLYTADTSAATIIVSSNWTTREATLQVLDVTDQELRDMEDADISCIESPPQYCVDDSMTTKVNARRGLIPVEGVEFIDRYPCYAPAAMTGSNPLADCGNGWQTTYEHGLVTILKNSLDSGRSIEFLSSKEACRIISTIGSKYPGLHVREINMVLTTKQPEDIPVGFALLLYSTSSSPSDIRNGSFIVCDYAPIWQRHATMPRYARVQSSLALAFFRAWCPHNELPPLTFEHAHSALTLTRFFGDKEHLGPRNVKAKRDLTSMDRIKSHKILVQTIHKLATMEATAKERMEVGEDQLHVRAVIECLKDRLDALPADTIAALTLDTPLQRVIALWKANAQVTMENRRKLEDVSGDLAQILQDQPQISMETLSARFPLIANSIIPYMKGERFKRKQRLVKKNCVPYRTDVQILYDLSRASVIWQPLARKVRQHFAAWDTDAENLTPEAQSVLLEYIWVFAHHVEEIPHSLEEKVDAARNIRKMLSNQWVPPAYKIVQPEDPGAARRAYHRDYHAQNREKMRLKRQRHAEKRRKDPVREAAHKAKQNRNKEAELAKWKADPVKYAADIAHRKAYKTEWSRQNRAKRRLDKEADAAYKTQRNASLKIKRAKQQGS